MARTLQIEINNYKRSNITDAQRANLKSTIRTHLNAMRNVETLDFYDLMGSRSNHFAGSDTRFVILVDTTLDSYSQNDVVLEQPVTMFGIESGIKKVHTIEGEGIPIVTDEGYIIAEYFLEGTRKNQLHIAFNLLENYNDNMQQIFGKILDQINAEFEKELLQFQWNDANRERISKEIQTKVSTFEARAKLDAERKLREAEDRVRHYKEEIVKNIRQVTRFRNDVDKYNELGGKVFSKFVTDLDLIQKLEKVREVRVENGVIHMFTNDIHTYADNGNTYYTGKFRVEFDPENANVKFFGDTPRKGYWTNEDPHPHVNGSNGQACLGNVDSTIAELSAQYEIYALANVLIDFLESANTSDSAGKNVVRWDRVAEDGKIISAETHECGCCGSNFTEDELVECYESDDLICRDCRREVITADGDRRWVSEDRLGDYEWNSEYDIYVSDSFDGELGEVMD